MELIHIILSWLFEHLILNPYYFLMNLYVRFSQHDFAEIVQGQSLSDLQMKQIRDFRNEMYKEKQDYLIPKNPEELKIEAEIDNRSFHGLAFDKNKELIAVIRYTPYPFETTAILGESKTIRFKRYLEISRLICKKKQSGVGKRLLIKGGYFAIKSKQYDGFIAICRNENCTIFQKFGLKTIYRFYYKDRGADYNFICANFFRVSAFTFNHFKRKAIIKLSSFI